jgi:hypothetical protein
LDTIIEVDSQSEEERLPPENTLLLGRLGELLASRGAAAHFTWEELQTNLDEAEPGTKRDLANEVSNQLPVRQ